MTRLPSKPGWNMLQVELLFGKIGSLHNLWFLPARIQREADGQRLACCNCLHYLCGGFEETSRRNRPVVDIYGGRYAVVVCD